MEGEEGEERESLRSSFGQVVERDRAREREREKERERASREKDGAVSHKCPHRIRFGRGCSINEHSEIEGKSKKDFNVTPTATDKSFNIGHSNAYSRSNMCSQRN